LLPKIFITSTAFTIQALTSLTIFSEGMTGAELAEDQSFTRNVESSIAAALGTSQSRVQVTEVIADGRRLIEDAQKLLASGRRLSQYVLTIKYEMYLDDKDQVAEVNSKLSDRTPQESFSKTFATYLAYNERAQGRDIEVSGVFVSSVEVIDSEATTTKPDTTSSISSATATTESRTATSTGSPTSTALLDQLAAQDQVAVAGYTCPSRHLSYAVFIIALVFAQ